MTSPVTPVNAQLSGGASNPYGVGYYPSGNMGTVTGIGEPAGFLSENTGVQTATSTPGMMSPLTFDPSSVSELPSATAAVDAGASSGGFDWSSILSGLGGIATGVGNALTSPLGSAAAMIGLGEYEASQAQSQTTSLTNQLTGPAQGFVQGGVNEQALAQKGLTGTPVTDGSIGQQEQAAAAAGQVATQDMQAVASGQLPSVYEQQIQQQVQAQQQQIRSQLASQGVTDGSVLAMYDQQIQNNATQQRQSILNNLQSQGAQAQQMVQQTYTNILNDSISQFGAGMGPIQDAVNLTVQQNTQIANGLQSLFGQIARGFSGASGSGGGAAGGTGAGAGGSPLGQIGNGVNQLLGGNTSALTSSINNTIGSGMSSVEGDLASSTASEEANVASDVASSNMDWLSGLGGNFSSAGGGAAGAGAGAAADALTPSVLGDFSFAPGLSSVGTGAVGAATDAAAADAAGALGSSAGAAGADAAGIGAAGTLGAAGLAIPVGIAAAGLMLGNAWTAKDDQGAAAMGDWMKATGATFVPTAGQSGSGGNTFESQQFSTMSNPGKWYGPNGQPMTEDQVANAIYSWAQQNGVSPGDIHPV